MRVPAPSICGPAIIAPHRTNEYRSPEDLADAPSEQECPNQIACAWPRRDLHAPHPPLRSVRILARSPSPREKGNIAAARFERSSPSLSRPASRQREHAAKTAQFAGNPRICDTPLPLHPPAPRRLISVDACIAPRGEGTTSRPRDDLECGLRPIAARNAASLRTDRGDGRSSASRRRFAGRSRSEKK